MSTKVKIDDKYNRLTVVSEPYYGEFDTQRHLCVLCQCSCNGINIIEVKISSLKNNNTKSCGCLNIERITKHGLSEHPIYTAYYNMKFRCYDERNISYKNYGGRGITIIQFWLDNLRLFYDWSMENGWAPGLEIDRIDTNGNYEPRNCRWSTEKVQNNNKRNNKLIEAFGETKTMKQWSEDDRCVIKYSTLKTRLLLNWNPERALIEKTWGGKEKLAFGETKNLKDWSKDKRCIVNYNALRARITTYGWDIELALTEPLTQ